MKNLSKIHFILALLAFIFGSKLKGQYYIKTPKLYDENHHFILNEKGEPIDIPEGDKYIYEYGFIAQDVEKIIPELVSQGETKHLNYTGIIPLLVEAIKDQQKQIEELKQKIK